MLYQQFYKKLSTFLIYEHLVTLNTHKTEIKRKEIATTKKGENAGEPPSLPNHFNGALVIYRQVVCV